MEKNTKGKLLAIGILVLFLVGMIPMAATAAPSTTKTIREIAYKLDGCPFPNQIEYSVTCTVGEKVGTVVIGKMDDETSTFDVSVSFSKLLPNREYVYVLMPTPTDGATTNDYPPSMAPEYPTAFQTDERGRFKYVMPTADYIRAQYEDLLNQGYIFGVAEFNP